jgi:hypothetical protein
MAQNSILDKHHLSSALEAKLKADADAKKEFCRCWPCASDVLTLLLKLSLPKKVGDVIKIIIAVGNGVSAELCK